MAIYEEGLLLVDLLELLLDPHGLGLLVNAVLEVTFVSLVLCLWVLCNRLLTRVVPLGIVLVMKVRAGANPTLARPLILSWTMFAVEVSVVVSVLCLSELLSMAQKIAVLCRLLAMCILAIAMNLSCGLPTCCLSTLVMTIRTCLVRCWVCRLDTRIFYCRYKRGGY